MIIFDNVTKEFPNGTTALQEVSFHIEPGEFLFITGASGAGKTTILRLILGELKPTAGKILVKGEEISLLKKKALPELRRQIGSVFQDYKLIDDRTISENVSLISEMIKQKKEEIDQHVEEILDLVGLKDKADLFPSQLSGGELQRTAIARALATQPQIIYADEPTGNLDEATTWEIINLLTKLNEDGTTVVIATHNQKIIDSLKKRIIELKDGRVVRDTKKPKKAVKKKTQEKAKKLEEKKEVQQEVENLGEIDKEKESEKNKQTEENKKQKK